MLLIDANYMKHDHYIYQRAFVLRIEFTLVLVPSIELH